MKYSLSIMAVGCCLLAGVPTTGFAQQHVIADKNQVTREIKVGSFNKLQLDCGFDIVYTPTADKQQLKLHIPDNIKELVQVYVEDHTLFMAIKPQTTITLTDNKRIELQVSAPMVESVVVNGTGNVRFTRDIRIPQLKLVVNGLGKISAGNLDSSNFQASVNGNGRISMVRVNSPQVHTCITGSGNLQLENTNATNLQAEVFGNGYMQIPQVQTVNANLTAYGAGQIKAVNINANYSKTIAYGNGSINVERITAPEAEAEIYGAGKLQVNKLQANTIATQVHNNGQMKLQGLEATQVDALVAGSGEIELKGKAETGTFNVVGIGRIIASSLLTQKAEASVNSHGGTIECYASQHMVINEFKNSHAVKVKGNPQQIERNYLEGKQAIQLIEM